MLPFGFDHSYARELEGLYVPCAPAQVPAPRLLFLDEELASELRLDAKALRRADGAALFAGNALPPDARPIAQAYAGHQFGGFSPQLGDGRALLIGELMARDGTRRDVAFKGSGRTPFSRGGDGKAAVGPMLREVLISASLHALGIPTTRALAVAATGEEVMREATLPGAVLTRVAASHLRVGTFQFVAARGNFDQLRRLADYAIARHDPALTALPDPYLGLLRAVAQRQAGLIAMWMNVGFIHGVMNTDNMTISGETIDFGPCAFMEAYDPGTVFSSIDHGGRYAYGNQPAIARWNLARLAEALLPLMAQADDEPGVRHAVALVTEVIDDFPRLYRAALLAGQRAKLGLPDERGASEVDDASLAQDWLALLESHAVDFTLGWRRLADAAEGHAGRLRELFAQPQALDAWLVRWRRRCSGVGGAEGAQGAALATRLRQSNPWIIPRNHRVEEALAAASDKGDPAPFERLLAALRRPYDETPDLTRYAEPAAHEVTAGYRTFCGT